MIKSLVVSSLLFLLVACASENAPDPAKMRADENARENFAKQLPKPADR